MGGKAFQWGIFGCGRIAHDFALTMKTLLPEKDHNILYAASKDPLKAENFAKKFEIKKFTGSYEEVVKCKEIDGIYIATLNPTHKPLSLLAMNHGKHVLCEKPVAMNSKELKEMLECSKTNNVFFMEGMWPRFTPGWKELYSLLHSKKYGEPRYMRVSGADEKFDKYERYYNPRFGGSILTDLGVYHLNFVDMVFEDYQLDKLVGLGNIDKSAKTDRSICVNMVFEHNKFAQIFASGECTVPSELSIYFDKCQLTVNRIYHPPGWVIKYFENGKIEETSIDAPLLANTEFPYASGLIYQVEHMRQMILAGNLESDVMTHATSLRIMEYMEDLRKQIGVHFPQDEH